MVNYEEERVVTISSDNERAESLFRGIPGFSEQPGDDLSADSSGSIPSLKFDPIELLPPNISQMAKASETLLICFGSIIGLWLLYWIGRAIQRRRNRSGTKEIMKINQQYKDLVEREETLQ